MVLTQPFPPSHATISQGKSFLWVQIDFGGSTELFCPVLHRMVALRHGFCNSQMGFVGATSVSDLVLFSALWFYCCWMKRAVCFYSRVLFVEHHVFELYPHSALGQCLVSDASQFPSCNCISHSGHFCVFHRMFFPGLYNSVSPREFPCHFARSHANTLLPWSFQVFSTSFFSWKVWWPTLTLFQKRTITCGPAAGHLHEELCSWENLIQKRTRAHESFVLAWQLMSY